MCTYSDSFQAVDTHHHNNNMQQEPCTPCMLACTITPFKEQGSGVAMTMAQALQAPKQETPMVQCNLMLVIHRKLQPHRQQQTAGNTVLIDLLTYFGFSGVALAKTRATSLNRRQSYSSCPGPGTPSPAAAFNLHVRSLSNNRMALHTGTYAAGSGATQHLHHHTHAALCHCHHSHQPTEPAAAMHHLCGTVTSHNT